MKRTPLLLLIFCLVLVSSGCGVQQASVGFADIEGPVPVATFKSELSEWTGEEAPTELTVNPEDFAYISPQPATTIHADLQGGRLLWNSISDFSAETMEISRSEDEFSFSATGVGAVKSSAIDAQAQKIALLTEQVTRLAQAQENRDAKVAEVAEMVTDLATTLAPLLGGVPIGPTP